MSSLKDYVELMEARAKHVMSSRKALGDDAKDYPCSVCEGEGLLVCIVHFARIRCASQKLQTSGGNPVTGMELIPCPACMSTGVDQQALLQRVRADDGGADAIRT